MADFYGKTVSEEQLQELAQHLNIDNFKNNKSVNMQDLNEAGVFRADGAFIRKGKNNTFLSSVVWVMTYRSGADTIINENHT